MYTFLSLQRTSQALSDIHTMQVSPHSQPSFQLVVHRRSAHRHQAWRTSTHQIQLSSATGHLAVARDLL
nr:hypothetical protein I308_03305 [Cryptococcus tetragattii IND107]